MWFQLLLFSVSDWRETKRERDLWILLLCYHTLHSATKGPRKKKGFAFPDGRNEVPVTICTHTTQSLVVHTILEKWENFPFLWLEVKKKYCCTVLCDFQCKVRAILFVKVIFAWKHTTFRCLYPRFSPSTCFPLCTWALSSISTFLLSLLSLAFTQYLLSPFF